MKNTSSDTNDIGNTIELSFVWLLIIGIIYKLKTNYYKFSVNIDVLIEFVSLVNHRVILEVG